MATTYAFQVSIPVTDLLPRNRVVNKLHFQHVAGGLTSTDLEDFAEGLLALYQARYENSTREINVKCYDTDNPPNYPRAEVVVNAGQAWQINSPREIALCLSYAGDHRGNKNERGRCYLMPGLSTNHNQMGLRPIPSQLDWALEWYGKSNESFPDLGGVDWKFGVWSPTLQQFTQTTQAWVNDDWDIQRKRGLRESTRVTVEREG